MKWKRLSFVCLSQSPLSLSRTDFGLTAALVFAYLKLLLVACWWCRRKINGHCGILRWDAQSLVQSALTLHSLMLAQHPSPFSSSDRRGQFVSLSQPALRPSAFPYLHVLWTHTGHDTHEFIYYTTHQHQHGDANLIITIWAAIITSSH